MMMLLFIFFWLVSPDGSSPDWIFPVLVLAMVMDYHLEKGPPGRW